MSDQPMGKPGDSEEGDAGSTPEDDKDVFAPETAGPSIDAPPLPPPPPPPPSVTEIGLPEENAVAADQPQGSEEPSQLEPESGQVPSGGVADVPWQVPSPTPPWPSQSSAAPASPEPSAPVPPEPPAPAPPEPPAPAPPEPPTPPGSPGAPTEPPTPPEPSAPSPEQPPAAPAAPAPQPGGPTPPGTPVPPGAPGAPPPAPYGAPQPPPPGAPYPAQVPGQYPPGYPPPAPGYPPQQAPAAAPYPYPAAPQVVDPHMVGSASNWLSAGAKRAAKAVLPVLAAVLQEGDVVELLMQGRVRGEPGLAALVGGKIVLVNARLWKPDVMAIPLTATLQVQGMNYGHAANVVFIEGQAQEAVEQISDQPMAYRFAEQVRMRAASLATPEPPAT